MSMTTELLKTVAAASGNKTQVDSIFRLIIVAGLRSKQLLRGSQPRIVANPLKRKNTSIALEEIKQGLVPFTVGKAGSNTNEPA